MTKQLFGDVNNIKLAKMIRFQLQRIKIILVAFESRPHNTEYAKIFYAYYCTLHFVAKSGKRKALLPFPPLRTVHATFAAHGSSLYNPCLTRGGSHFIVTAVHLSITLRM